MGQWDERESSPGSYPVVISCLICGLWQRLGKVFWKGPKSKYIRLLRISSLCHNYLTLTLYPESSHRQQVKEWMWPYSCMLWIQNRWRPEFGLQGVVCWLWVYGIHFWVWHTKDLSLSRFFLPGISKIHSEGFTYTLLPHHLFYYKSSRSWTTATTAWNRQEGRKRELSILNKHCLIIGKSDANWIKLWNCCVPIDNSLTIRYLRSIVLNRYLI